MKNLRCLSKISTYVLILSILFGSSAFALTLTVNNGSGGGDYLENATVPILAAAAPASQEFDQWVIISGDATILDIMASDTSVTMGLSDTTIEATYKPILYSLTVNSGTGGGDYASGETATITAGMPPAGEEFETWAINSGSPSIPLPNETPTILTMGNNPATVTATYKIIARGISGTVTVGGIGLGGVSLTISDASSTTVTTDASGNFSFGSIEYGSYTITPLLIGHTFSPATQDVTVDGTDITGVNYVATALPVTATLTADPVLLQDGTRDTTLEWGSTNADSVNIAPDPGFSLPDVNGTGVATPKTTTIYTVTATNTHSGNTATATVEVTPYYNITGTVTITAGVTSVTLTLYDATDSVVETTNPNDSGDYSFINIVNGTYTIVPSLIGYSFTSATVDLTTGEDAEIDFEATIADVSVTLTAAPANTLNGGDSLLTWTSSEADGVSIDQGIGAVDTEGGAVTVNPAVTTTYTITASNTLSGRTATANVTVTPYYDITGTVTLSSDGVTSIALTLYDAADAVVGTTYPNDLGAYSFTTIVNGTYTLVPELIGHSFTTETVDLTTGNEAVINFVATALPVTATLTADPVLLQNGTRDTTLTWGSTHADSVSIAPYPGFSLPDVNGSGVATPKATTTYTLTATNTYSGSTATATVEVTPYYDITGTVGLSDVTITLNDATNAVVATTISDGLGAYSFTNILNGTYTVVPSLLGYSFTPAPVNLTTGSDAVINFTSSIAEVSVSLIADPVMPQTGVSSSLSWTSSQADTLSIDQGIGTVAPEGDMIVDPDVTTTYTITASNSSTNSTATQSVTITPVYDITGTLTLLPLGVSEVTLTLTDGANNVLGTTHPDALGVYSFTDVANGVYTVTPALIGYSFTPATADLTTGADATIDFEATIEPVTVTLAADPLIIMEGGSTKLTWTSTQANVISIDQSIGDVEANGMLILSPENTTIYTITASNSYTAMSATQSVTVSVKGIYDLSGQVTGGGVVSVILSGKTDIVVKSDSSGNYTFLNVEEGTYSLSAYMDGYTFGYKIIILDQDLTNINLAAMLPWSGNKQFGSNDEDDAWAIHRDMSGNVYIAGKTLGVMGSANDGGYDVYLRKYSPSGTLLWTEQIGSTPTDFGDGDNAYGIATDSTGNVYVTGYTYGIMGSGSFGKIDAFVIKYNSAGTIQWKQQIGTADGEIAYGIAVFENYVYITGYTNGILDGSPNHPFGAEDMFLCQYTLDGVLQWTKEQGYSGTDKGQGVAVSLTGDIYVTGYTNDSLEGEIYSGLGDIFLSKFNSTGDLVWTRLLGSTEPDMGTSVTVSSAGDIYVGAQTKGSIDSVNQGLWDYLIAKYDSEGVQQWVRQSGSAGDDIVKGISSFGASSIYLTGYTDGDLGGFTSAGLNDVFVVKYNSDGIEQWIRMAGTDKNDYGQAISAKASDALFIGGFTEGGYFNGNPSDEDKDPFIVNYELSGALEGAYDEATNYVLTVNNGSGGGTYAPGITTPISADLAPDGQEFDQWVVNSGNPQIDNPYTQSTSVIIGSSDMEVTATYKNQTVTTLALTVNFGTGDGSYEEGASTTITADPDPAGQEFDFWLIISGSPLIAALYESSTTLTMGSTDAMVTATYKNIATTFTLTVTNGSGSGSYTAGYTVPITANAAPSGQVFDGWDATTGSPSIANSGASSTTVTMPSTLATVTATYRALPDSENLVLPANGGVLQSFTPADIGQGAEDLTNGITNEVGWSSALSPTESQEFVYAFNGGQNATVDEAVIYNGTAEGQYFCEEVAVWTSLDGVTYKEAANGVLDPSENSITLSLGNTVAKTVKLVISSGFSTEYWELGEFEVYGTLEGVQPNIETFGSYYDSLKTITLKASEGTTVSGVQATDVPETPPVGADFPYGVFDFTIDNVGAGGSTTVTLYLPSDATPTSYYKYGRTPDDTTDHWYEFLYDAVTDTGAVINGNVITLHFFDGLRGDDDLDGTNGIIVDPGAPIIMTTDSDETPDDDDPGISGNSESYGESGGGSCFIGSLLDK